MKKLTNFILSLQFIFKPRYWLMNRPYSEVHDVAITKLMNESRFENIGDYTATLNETEIWVANYPNAVGIMGLEAMSRPSRLTIKRIGKKLEEDYAYQILNNPKP
jgi:hypothetical protein